MAAHQAPLSLGFSRQEHWSGLPFPSPMHERESEVAQLCLTLHDPMDCRLPGSSVHGILQARGLEWGAMATTTSILVHLETISRNPGKVIYLVVKFCNLLLGYSGFSNEYAPLLGKLLREKLGMELGKVKGSSDYDTG